MSSSYKSMNAIDPEERKKISQLQTEMTSGGKDKVEWLYGGDKVDREAYLLGKPIDKLITEKNEDEKQKASAIVFSTIDLANKIREDPLFEIKKREIEAKKKLLENPVKIKQLKELISKSSGKRDGDEKSHKSKEHKRSHRDRDEDRHYRHRSRSTSRSRDRERERDDDRHRHSRSSHHQTSSSSSSGRRREGSDNNGYGYIETKRRRSASRSDDDRKTSEKIEEIHKYKKRIEDLKNIRDKKPSYNKHDQPSVKKLSDEEKRRKLEEMTKNAQWRNEIRSTNVKRYKDDDEKEDDERDRRTEPTQVFNDMMRDAYTSAADRIKSNVKNIQRGESAYDKNFARK